LHHPEIDKISPVRPVITGTADLVASAGSNLIPYSEEETAMLCTHCVHWTTETFTYETLEKTWDDLHDTPITPGLKTKFRKEAERLGKDFSEVELPFLYCRKGRLNRFYIIRKNGDQRPRKSVTSCPFYSFGTEDTKTSPINGPLWQFCTTEAHGPTVVRGHQFYPGLCENFTYFRLPAHRAIRLEIGVSGQCSVCGDPFDRGMVVRETTWFCSNRHYLQWWRLRNPKLFEKLNRSR
jgi:hypothetical protein